MKSEKNTLGREFKEFFAPDFFFIYFTQNWRDRVVTCSEKASGSDTSPGQQHRQWKSVCGNPSQPHTPSGGDKIY